MNIPSSSQYAIHKQSQRPALFVAPATADQEESPVKDTFATVMSNNLELTTALGVGATATVLGGFSTALHLESVLGTLHPLAFVGTAVAGGAAFGLAGGLVSAGLTKGAGVLASKAVSAEHKQTAEVFGKAVAAAALGSLSLFPIPQLAMRNFTLNGLAIVAGSAGLAQMNIDLTSKVAGT